MVESAIEFTDSSIANDVEATTRIYAFEVKEEFCGYYLDGLLFHQVISFLASHYYSKEQQRQQQEEQEVNKGSLLYGTYK
jgi:hypothetical protein